MRLHLSRSDFESLGVSSQNRYRYKKHSSRKLECVSFKMGYRGLPVRKHSAWDPFRRPRGLDFRVCDFTDFLALKNKFTGPKFTATRAAVHRTWPDGLRGGYNSPGWLIALTASPPASICHQTT